MTKLFLNQLYFINSLIKRNSKKVQDLSFISTQQPSELPYKGGSRNRSRPALKEFQLQKKAFCRATQQGWIKLHKKSPAFLPPPKGCGQRSPWEAVYWSYWNCSWCKPWEKVGADTQSTEPGEQGALRPPGCSQPFLFIPPLPHPRLQSLPQPPAPLLTDIHYQPLVCRIRFSLFLLHTELNWLILKLFFFNPWVISCDLHSIPLNLIHRMQ